MSKKYAIGSKIRERRSELGITQEELAGRLGYNSKSAIARIEAGDVDVAQTKILTFANALHTTPDYLLGLTDDSKIPVNKDSDFKLDKEMMELLSELDEERYAMVLAYIKLIRKS